MPSPTDAAIFGIDLMIGEGLIISSILLMVIPAKIEIIKLSFPLSSLFFKSIKISLYIFGFVAIIITSKLLKLFRQYFCKN